MSKAEHRKLMDELRDVMHLHVLKQPLNQEINAVRASRKENVPFVMTHEEVAQVISLIEGMPQIKGVVLVLMPFKIRLSSV